jgi:hypothetical protein
MSCLNSNSKLVNFTRPTIPILVPDTLERVGPFGKKKYILWTEMVNEDFVAWWLKTEFGSAIKRNIFEHKRQASVWDHFHQVAAIHDGSPKVMWKSCDHVIAHPADRHRGTSTMNKHYLQAAACQKGKRSSQDIRKLISNVVRALDDWSAFLLT